LDLTKRDSLEFAVWDDITEEVQSQQVFCPKISLAAPQPLPITAKRLGNNKKVGFAAQYFNKPTVPGVVSGWITGNMNQT
jgi:hypothetical protein